MIRRALRLLLVLSLSAAGCAPSTTEDAGPPPDPIFPADVETSFTEVRDCRSSIEHDLRFVRVFADELAHEPYTTRDGGFPDEATVVKVEYVDDECNDVIGYTAMRRLPAGTSSEGLDWHWQSADAERRVNADGALARCVGCHERCEGGFESTCMEP